MNLVIVEVSYKGKPFFQKVSAFTTLIEVKQVACAYFNLPLSSVDLMYSRKVLIGADLLPLKKFCKRSRTIDFALEPSTKPLPNLTITLRNFNDRSQILNILSQAIHFNKISFEYYLTISQRSIVFYFESQKATSQVIKEIERIKDFNVAFRTIIVTVGVNKNKNNLIISEEAKKTNMMVLSTCLPSFLPSIRVSSPYMSPDDRLRQREKESMRKWTDVSGFSSFTKRQAINESAWKEKSFFKVGFKQV